MTQKPLSSCIRTFTGALFDFLNPEQSPISIEDIAHSLSLLCRFAGHCRVFYSVAEHAVRVSYVCDPKHTEWGLHHDDSESYCVDVPRPLKHLLNMESYRDHEKRVQKAICKQLGIRPWVEPPEVKLADMVLLVTEQRDLLRNSIPDFLIDPLPRKIRPWSSGKAKRMFLARYHELRGHKLSWWQKFLLWKLRLELNQT